MWFILDITYVLCVLAIDPGTSTECTETPVCEEPGRYLNGKGLSISSIPTTLMAVPMLFFLHFCSLSIYHKLFMVPFILCLTVFG